MTEDKKNLLRKFAERGYRLIPLYYPKEQGVCSCSAGAECRAVGKHPILKAWQIKASCNWHQVETWLKEFPSCNWGLATGPESGVSVIDVDGRNGGFESLKALPEFKTFTVETGGGLHFYCRQEKDEQIKSRPSALAGIDIKGNGGMVVIPPSLHNSGARYKIRHDRPLISFPKELFEEDNKIKVFKEKKPRSIPVHKEQKTIRRNKKVLVSGVISEGDRNDALFNIGIWFINNRSKKYIRLLGYLRGVNRRKFRPMLEDAEVAKTAKSVIKYA
ncbi:bifunctional DNA primase/polymerase [Parelusimicrobium proximum]|uniref:bifunctional DNA primase/polymerase n=1 Tax=Parelusimicrobium proximum TaxID=3228953 RepID=UPI003D177440